MRNRVRIATVVCASALALAGCRAHERKGEGQVDARAPRPAKRLTVAVIPQGNTYDFWKSIHAGAVKASRDLAAAGAPVEVIWKGPLREDDR